MDENPYQAPAEFEEQVPPGKEFPRLTLRDWLLIGAVVLGMVAFTFMSTILIGH